MPGSPGLLNQYCERRTRLPGFFLLLPAMMIASSPGLLPPKEYAQSPRRSMAAKGHLNHWTSVRIRSGGFVLAKRSSVRRLPPGVGVGWARRWHYLSTGESLSCAVPTMDGAACIDAVGGHGARESLIYVEGCAPSPSKTGVNALMAHLQDCALH